LRLTPGTLTPEQLTKVIINRMNNRSKKVERLDSTANNEPKVVASVKTSSIQKSAASKEESLSTNERELLVECETDINENLKGAFILGWQAKQIKKEAA